MFSAALYAHVRTSSTIAHETAGAARIRHSLRPLIGEGERFFPQLGRSAPRERKSISAVIASEAKQSMSRHNDRWIASSQKLPCANALRLSQAMTAEMFDN
jgi:hypothetical protein